MLADLSPHYKKFHLGCGTIFIKDYLNIGYWHHLGVDTLYGSPNGVEGSVLYNHDLVLGIPAADDSLDVVYHSRLLEHMSYAEGIEFIAACHRVLRPGGILRVLVPDLELWCANYVANNDFFFDEYRRGALNDDRALYPTKGSVFMGALHNHGHKCGYDFATLRSVLDRAGFNAIRRTMVQDSELPDIAVVEPYSPLRALETLCVECRK